MIVLTPKHEKYACTRYLTLATQQIRVLARMGVLDARQVIQESVAALSRIGTPAYTILPSYPKHSLQGYFFPTSLILSQTPLYQRSTDTYRIILFFACVYAFVYQGNSARELWLKGYQANQMHQIILPTDISDALLAELLSLWVKATKAYAAKEIDLGKNPRELYASHRLSRLTKDAITEGFADIFRDFDLALYSYWVEKVGTDGILEDITPPYI